MPHRWPKHSDRGVGVVELVSNMAIILVLAATSLPTVSRTVQSYKAIGDARTVVSQLTLTRMRAAADFTQAQWNADLTAGTYQVQVYNKAGGSFSTEGGTQYLSRDITFGFGTISTPAGAQSSIAQTPQVLFNSRGIPVDSSGAPTGSYAIYLTNGSGLYYAVTVSVSGVIAIWQFKGSTWVQCS